MLDGSEMLAAIASARDARLRRRAMLRKGALAMAIAAFVGAVGILAATCLPKPDAIAAEPTDRLSIEEAIWEAIADDSDFPMVDWEYWLGVNPDIVGWVTVKETGIDHPIVLAKAESPTFYLSHGIDRSADPKGCIFQDAECEEGLESMHSVVYGHNWSGGLLFADLAKYADAAFAAEHEEILLQTPEAKTRLSVQCVEMANGTDDSNVIGFTNADAMAAWYRARYAASGVKLAPESLGAQAERIFTFCTCASGGGDKRVLVYAIPATKARAASRETASTA